MVGLVEVFGGVVVGFCLECGGEGGAGDFGASVGVTVGAGEC